MNVNCPYCGELLPERTDETDCKNWRCYTCKVLWIDRGQELWTWKGNIDETGFKQVPDGTLLIASEL